MGVAHNFCAQLNRKDCDEDDGWLVCKDTGCNGLASFDDAGCIFGLGRTAAVMFRGMPKSFANLAFRLRAALRRAPWLRLRCPVQARRHI